MLLTAASSCNWFRTISKTTILYPSLLWTPIRHSSKKTRSNATSKPTGKTAPKSKAKKQLNPASGSSPTLVKRTLPKIPATKDRTNYEVIAAALRETPPDLPSLPPKPEGYPTPHITNTNLSDYIVPLYSCGWGVTRECYDMTDSQIIPKLIRSYWFNKFSYAIAFINDVAKLCQDEMHHPTTIRLDNIDYVVIQLCTHSGLRSPKAKVEKKKTRTTPGITIRDVRLAMRIEDIFRTVYLPSAHGKIETGEILPRNLQPRSIKSFYPKR